MEEEEAEAVDLGEEAGVEVVVVEEDRVGSRKSLEEVL